MLKFSQILCDGELFWDCLSCRLESQMTADIQTILQLLQKQTTVVPPAYSMVTSGAEYQRPIIHPVRTSHPGASIKTDRSFSPSSQVSIESIKPRVSLKVFSKDHLNQNYLGCCRKCRFSFYLISISGNGACNLHFTQTLLILMLI